MKKKLILLFLMLTTFISGCTGLAANPSSIKLQEAKNALSLNFSEVSENFTLPNKGSHDAAITWVSSNEEAIKIEGDKALVTRTNDDVSVKLTASILYDSKTAQKDFNVVVKGLHGQKIAKITFNITVPSNTPVTDNVFIAGDFGKDFPNWEPGSNWGKTTRISNTLFKFEFEFVLTGTVNIEYKYARGNWDKVEKSKTNGEISNRKLTISEENYIITVDDNVEKWADMALPEDQSGEPKTAKITFNITVPSNTPATDNVYIVGSLGPDAPSWEPGSNWGKTTKISDTHFKFEYELTITGTTYFEYKYTRGDWGKVEKTVTNDEVNNRTLVISLDNYVITVNDTVNKWADIDLPQEQPGEEIIAKITFNITVPSNTPALDSVYIVGDFGPNFPNWQAGDPWGKTTKISDTEFKFEFEFTITTTVTIQYKYTRGDWGNVEKSNTNEEVANRSLTISLENHIITVNDIIAKWADVN